MAPRHHPSVLEAQRRVPDSSDESLRAVYEIGRGNRPEGYNCIFKRPLTIVARTYGRIEGTALCYS